MPQYPEIKNRPGASSENGREALEAEIVEPEAGNNGERGTYGKTYGQYGQWKTYGAFSSTGSDGCLAALITFTLFMAFLFKFGLLAALGFFVFHLVGSIITFVCELKSVLSGRPFARWSHRIVNWCVSGMLILLLCDVM